MEDMVSTCTYLFLQINLCVNSRAVFITRLTNGVRRDSEKVWSIVSMIFFFYVLVHQGACVGRSWQNFMEDILMYIQFCLNRALNRVKLLIVLDGGALKALQDSRLVSARKARLLQIWPLTHTCYSRCRVATVRGGKPSDSGISSGTLSKHV